jgi:hypothetical protein
LKNIEFGLYYIIGAEVTESKMKKKTYSSCARLSLKRNELTAYKPIVHKLTAYMDASEDEPEEAVFDLKETDGKIEKDKR